MGSYKLFHDKPMSGSKRLGFFLKSSLVILVFLPFIAIYFIYKEPSLDPRYHFINQLPSCQLDRNRVPSRLNITKLVKNFQNCVRPIVERWRNDTYSINEKWELTAKCDKVFDVLPITFMKNKDEQKWTILPNCKEENVMVTMGIGHDTRAEEQLSRTLPNTKFYGADPVIDINRDLYSKFGKFFPFAMGRTPGILSFRTLDERYEFQDVTTIPFTYFLADILKLKMIDIAWIDIEGGELHFLDQFHRGEELDKKGVTICQFNMEIHSAFFPEKAVVYHDFIFRILEEKRYVFLKPIRTTPGVHKMYFINVENKQCVRKFLQ